MEPLTIFASAVGLVGVFHLISTTVESFSKKAGPNSIKKAKREDWYCFFKPSSLFGTTTQAGEKKGNVQATKLSVKEREKRQRQEANRPRLRV